MSENDVGLHGDRGTAHFSGVERCASIWACPVCAAVIRAERAIEIQQAAANWQAAGGSLVFVTLTVRHKRGDGLAGSLDAVLKAWRRLLQGKAWTEFKNDFGIEGYIRSVEVTLGANGWHPHIHALFFTNKPLTSADATKWESDMLTRWSQYVTDFGARLPSKLRGIDVRPADQDGKVVAQYLAKVQDAKSDRRPGVGVGQEMARFDFKTGRGGSLMPFELLDPESRQDNADDRAAMVLWNEYVAATAGRRSITWSRGLREWVNLEPERSDEEIIQDAEDEPLVMRIPGEVYDVMSRQPAVLALVLEAVEGGNWERIGQMVTGGTLSKDGPLIEKRSMTGSARAHAYRLATLGKLGPVPDLAS